MKYEPLLDNKLLEEDKPLDKDKFKRKLEDENNLLNQKEQGRNNKQQKEKTLYGDFDVYHSANFLSKLFFCWIISVLKVSIYNILILIFIFENIQI